MAINERQILPKLIFYFRGKNALSVHLIFLFLVTIIIFFFLNRQPPSLQPDYLAFVACAEFRRRMNCWGVEISRESVTSFWKGKRIAGIFVLYFRHLVRLVRSLMSNVYVLCWQCCRKTSLQGMENSKHYNMLWFQDEATSEALRMIEEIHQPFH